MREGRATCGTQRSRPAPVRTAAESPLGGEARACHQRHCDPDEQRRLVAMGRDTGERSKQEDSTAPTAADSASSRELVQATPVDRGPVTIVKAEELVHHRPQRQRHQHRITELLSALAKPEIRNAAPSATVSPRTTHGGAPYLAARRRACARPGSPRTQGGGPRPRPHAPTAPGRSHRRTPARPDGAHTRGRAPCYGASLDPIVRHSLRVISLAHTPACGGTGAY